MKAFLRHFAGEHGGIKGGLALASIIMAVGAGTIAHNVGGPAAGTANLWIDTNGGTCTRSASAVAYVDASACSSLNAAYQAASLGDSVLVKGGSYGSQTIDDEPTKDTTGLAADVVFDEASGESVTFSSINLGTALNAGDGPDHLTLRNFAAPATSRTCGMNATGSETVAELGDVTIDAIDTTCFQFFGVQNVQIKNSDIGPLSCAAAGDPCNSKVDAQAGGVTSNDNIKIGPYNVFHDDVFASNCAPISSPGDDCHGELLILFAGTNITVNSNRFYAGEVYGVMMQRAGGAPVEVLIENNWFGETYNSSLGAPQSSQRGTSICFCGTNMTNITVRGNSFALNENISNEGGGTATNVNILGNTFGGPSGGCFSGATFQYNTWTSGTCGASDLVMATLPYVNGGLLATGDYHLTGADSTADNAWASVTGLNNLTEDYDAQSRPQGANKDIGSDER